MLDDKDITKLTEAFSAVFTTKQEIHNLDEKIQKNFSELITSVDGYSKKADTYFQEMLMLSVKVDRHEKWLQEIASKLNLKLEY